MRDPRGATLVETMVVCAVLGVIAALAVPQLTPLAKDSEARTDAESVASFLDGAHRRALTEGRCFRVRLVSNELVLERRQSADCVNLAQDSWSGALEHLPVGKGTTLALESLTVPAAVVAADHRIVFRPNGRLYGNGNLASADDGARVLLTRTDMPRSRSVLVTPAGRICALVHGVPPPALVAPVICP